MGPKCVQGPCPEGKMTCGKIVEIREKFKIL
jgi:thymidylate synthase (FAD)